MILDDTKFSSIYNPESPEGPHRSQVEQWARGVGAALSAFRRMYEIYAEPGSFDCGRKRRDLCDVHNAFVAVCDHTWWAANRGALSGREKAVQERLRSAGLLGIYDAWIEKDSDMAAAIVVGIAEAFKDPEFYRGFESKDVIAIGRWFARYAGFMGIDEALLLAVSGRPRADLYAQGRNPDPGGWRGEATRVHVAITRGGKRGE